METKKTQKPLSLLEGELLLGKGTLIGQSEVKISILDVTHIDDQSRVLAESIEELTIDQEQRKIHYQIFGPPPDTSRSYIVVATISVAGEKGKKETLYRTTQSIPVFRKGDSKSIDIPLTKMD